MGQFPDWSAAAFNVSIRIGERGSKMNTPLALAKLAALGIPPDKLEEALQILEMLVAEVRSTENIGRARERERKKRYRDARLKTDRDGTERPDLVQCQMDDN
jgi:hypothetical protein